VSLSCTHRFQDTTTLTVYCTYVTFCNSEKMAINGVTSTTNNAECCMSNVWLFRRVAGHRGIVSRTVRVRKKRSFHFSFTKTKINTANAKVVSYVYISIFTHYWSSYIISVCCLFSKSIVQRVYIIVTIVGLVLWCAYLDVLVSLFAVSKMFWICATSDLYNVSQKNKTLNSCP